MPTFIAFRKGEEVEQIVGAEIDKIEALLEQYGPRHPDPQSLCPHFVFSCCGDCAGSPTYPRHGRPQINKVA